MKKLVSVLSVVVFFIAAGIAVAGDMNMPPYEGSEALQQIKALEGMWEGVSSEGGKEEPAEVVYEVTSNGSVVMEHLFPGTPHAMLTTYYDKGGKVNMVHYCAIGNRPIMELISVKDNKLNFVLSPDSDIKPNEPHMHSLTITIVDENRIVHEWGFYQDGKPAAETSKFTFTRIE